MAKLENPISRRNFAQLASLGLAAFGLRSYMVNERESIESIESMSSPALGAIRLGSNESPYGPAPAVYDAMRHALRYVWQYPGSEERALVEDLASFHGLEAECILLANGSSEILNLCAATFAGPGRPVVMADPTFGAILDYARSNKADAVRIPLATKYWHDLDRMLCDKAGLIYICNPNNPTATMTPKSELLAFLVRVPARTVVVIDEAYYHYIEGGLKPSLIPDVMGFSNLIVVRTFSKAYGLAGLRCGYAVARPGLVKRLRTQQSLDSLNILALIAARASIKEAEYVEQVSLLNHETRTFVLSGLKSMGYCALPSEANFIMIDMCQDVGRIVESLSELGVEVGSRCLAMPNFLRVTIGTRPQMETFLAALGKTLEV